jgi:hypothetical protein
MRSTAKLAMSPREKHIPDDAVRTTVSLTVEDRAAIRWISDVRRSLKNRRTTTNDILVDALWNFAEKIHGKSKQEIHAMVPIAPPEEHTKTKVTQMPKPKNKR